MTAIRYRRNVVTYRLAYLAGETTLCDKHSARPLRFGHLGAISHGSRPGICDECLAIGIPTTILTEGPTP
jgi:hypothetical protein